LPLNPFSDFFKFLPPFFYRILNLFDSRVSNYFASDCACFVDFLLLSVRSLVSGDALEKFPYVIRTFFFCVLRALVSLGLAQFSSPFSRTTVVPNHSFRSIGNPILGRAVSRFPLRLFPSFLSPYLLPLIAFDICSLLPLKQSLLGDYFGSPFFRPALPGPKTVFSFERTRKTRMFWTCGRWISSIR